MSYILDALRKSEHERQIAEGSRADMLAPAVVTNASARLPMLPIIAGVTLLVVATLAWWIRPSTPSIPPADPAPVAARLAPSVAPAAALALAPVPAPASAALPAPALAPTPATAISTVSTPTSQKPLPPEIRRPAAKLPVVRPAAPALPQMNAEPAVKPAGSANPKEETGENLKGLPALTISGFIQDDQGANLAIINDRLVREGEEVAPGLRLEEIVDEKAVFSFRGHRFRR